MLSSKTTNLNEHAEAKISCELSIYNCGWRFCEMHYGRGLCEDGAFTVLLLAAEKKEMRSNNQQSIEVDGKHGLKLVGSSGLNPLKINPVPSD